MSSRELREDRPPCPEVVVEREELSKPEETKKKERPLGIPGGVESEDRTIGDALNGVIENHPNPNTVQTNVE